MSHITIFRPLEHSIAIYFLSFWIDDLNDCLEAIMEGFLFISDTFLGVDLVILFVLVTGSVWLRL